VARISRDVRAALAVRVVEDRAQVGGGALPTVELPTAAVALGAGPEAARALDEALRRGDPPVVGRIVDDRLLLDCRTVLPAQVAILAAAIVVAARVIVVAGTASPPHAEGGLP
jgi:L-seryl-tRNA(Ser) seleniumtransferase